MHGVRSVGLRYLRRVLWHGGVNCAVLQSATGYAVCNDGWISSVQFSQMDECFLSSCVAPAPQCSQATLNQIQNSISQQETLNPTGAEQIQQFSPYNPTGASNLSGNSQLNELQGQLANCQSEINLYNSQLQTYSQCLSNEQAQRQATMQQFLATHTQQSQSAQSSSAITPTQNSVTPSTAPRPTAPAPVVPPALPSQPQASTPPPVVPPVSPLVAAPAPRQAESFSISGNMKVGQSGQSVITLQKFLESKNLLTLPAGMAEGYFGNLTKQALIAFQKSAGLPATGFCGTMTRAAISSGQ